MFQNVVSGCTSSRHDSRFPRSVVHARRALPSLMLRHRGSSTQGGKEEEAGLKFSWQWVAAGSSALHCQPTSQHRARGRPSVRPRSLVVARDQQSARPLGRRAFNEQPSVRGDCWDFNAKPTLLGKTHHWYLSNHRDAPVDYNQIILGSCHSILVVTLIRSLQRTTTPDITIKTRRGFVYCHSHVCSSGLVVCSDSWRYGFHSVITKRILPSLQLPQKLGFFIHLLLNMMTLNNNCWSSFYYEDHLYLLFIGRVLTFSKALPERRRVFGRLGPSQIGHSGYVARIPIKNHDYGDGAAALLSQPCGPPSQYAVSQWQHEDQTGPMCGLWPPHLGPVLVKCFGPSLAR